MDMGFDPGWSSADETSYMSPDDHEIDGYESGPTWEDEDTRESIPEDANDESETETVMERVTENSESSPTEDSDRTDTAQPPTKPVEPAHADFISWVDDFFINVIRRRINPEAGEGLAWDPRWWLYPEVVGRLAALHGAWEEARASDKPSAMSSWWIHHLEPHLRVLLDGETGPMALAKDDGSWSGFPQMGNHPIPPSMRETILSTNTDAKAGN